MVPDGRQAFATTSGSSTTPPPTGARPTTSPPSTPRSSPPLRELFLIEAAKYQVFPLDDRVTERENPTARRAARPARRPPLGHLPRAARAGCTEETTPERQEPLPHRGRRRRRPPTRDRGRDRRPGRALRGLGALLPRRAPCYVYNYFGTGPAHVLRGAEPMPAGRHEVRMDFDYDGGGVGRGGTVVLIRGRREGRRRPCRTPPSRTTSRSTRPSTSASTSGTPVSDDYPTVGNALHRHRAHGPDRARRRGGDLPEDGGLYRRVMTAQ